MNTIAVTVLGNDRPGIVCEAASALSEMNCNIEDVSQTVLQEEFSGIFIVSAPGDTTSEKLGEILNQRLSPQGLVAYATQVNKQQSRPSSETSEPFVVISIGRDRVGLIAGITSVMKEFQVNISNLQFINRTSTFPEQTVTIYEVDIPNKIRLSDFVSAIRDKGSRLGVEVSVQHKKIFEDINRL